MTSHRLLTILIGHCALQCLICAAMFVMDIRMHPLVAATQIAGATVLGVLAAMSVGLEQRAESEQ